MVLFSLAAAPARAEVGLSASLSSDIRYRGLSFTDGRAGLRLTATYDHPSGVYAGLSALGSATGHDGVQVLGYQANLGYAGRTARGASWDVGVSNFDVTTHTYNRYRNQYAEAYAGFSSRNVSAHVYYSPNYFGGRVDTVYVDLSGTLRPSETWSLIGHVGSFTLLNPLPGFAGRKTRYDLKLGVAAKLKSSEVQLAWTSLPQGTNYPPGQPQKRNALVLSATYFF